MVMPSQQLSGISAPSSSSSSHSYRHQHSNASSSNTTTSSSTSTRGGQLRRRFVSLPRALFLSGKRKHKKQQQQEPQQHQQPSKRYASDWNMKRRHPSTPSATTSTHNPRPTMTTSTSSQNPSSNNDPMAATTSTAASAQIETTTRYRFNNNQQQATLQQQQQSPLLSNPSTSSTVSNTDDEDHGDRMNYALLIALYTLQGIPMGLSASIPFLIQQKLQALASATASANVVGETVAAASAHADALAQATKMSYKANAIFALCSWPFSLKLLWAPIVDACFFKSFGRRKSWLVPVQALAGLLMVTGANFVERQLGLSSSSFGSTGASSLLSSPSFNVKGVTAFFFVLYFLMATQDIAVDGWALTMLSKKNRGRGPVCNSIGQNIGYFLSFVGFLALNDAESSEMIWRPLLGLPSNPEKGLVSLGGFIRFMGYFMLATTTAVALFKREVRSPDPASMSKTNQSMPESSQALLQSDRLQNMSLDEEHELDASEIGLKETYRRLWAVCQLPAVQWLFVILFTYRLPTALNDNVKFLKAVEWGLSTSTTALLSPTVILPLGILVPLVATRIWHGHPLRQFMTAYKFRVTLVPLLDAFMLWVLHTNQQNPGSSMSRVLLFWVAVVSSTAMQAIVSSLQFNAQMIFFASRVDPAIGGSYMTLLNTAANLGGTYPASFIMWLVGALTKPATCVPSPDALDAEICTGGRDPFFGLQIGFALLGCLWIAVLGRRVQRIQDLPEDAWRTHWLDKQLSSQNSTAFDFEQQQELQTDNTTIAEATTAWYRNEKNE